MDEATRSWLLAQLGTATNLADLDARYTRLGKARAVAIEVLNQRLADLFSNQPASVTIPNAIGLGYAENIKAIERKIALLEAADAPPAPDEPADNTSDDDTDPGWSIVQLIERPRR
ncbi:hypothetical protein [Streptomyces tubercidicus]|uniref:hypothetical protein n=1 Tax=Streptomyces tubercidicus TaxID=47759 RepID=UPI0034678A63